MEDSTIKIQNDEKPILIENEPGPFVKKIFTNQNGRLIDTGYKLRRTKKGKFRTEN